MVICFQFPKNTILPAIMGKTQEECVVLLGRRYLDKSLSIFNGLFLKRKIFSHSVKSAISAIISRNHSHHIGSHVTPRTSIEKIEKRLKSLMDDDKDIIIPEIVDKIIKSHKLKLDEYIQKKADFTAEIATEPIISTKRSMFFNEVFLGFIQNTLLMDNLGANEGVLYRPVVDANEGKTSENRLKINVLLNDEPVQAQFIDPDDDEMQIGYTRYPYSGLSPLGNDLVLDKSDKDFYISLPGPMGEFALYSFLENYIRNTIKHNAERIKKTNDDVEIFINLTECSEHNKDFYRCQIWDNMTRSDKNLKQKLEKHIRQDLIDKEGRLRKEAWGIAEMKIMATLLKGSTEFLNMKNNLILRTMKKGNKEVMLYEFDVMKPKEVAVVTAMNLEGYNSFESKEGISYFNDFNDLIQSLVNAPIYYNFILINQLQDISHETIKANIHKLPGRIVVHENMELDINGVCNISDAYFSKMIETKDSDKFILLLWQAWLSMLKNKHGYNNPRISLFFQQEEGISPTKEWKRVAADSNSFLQGDINASVIYQSSDENRNYMKPKSRLGLEDESHFMFDRHGGGFDILRNVKNRKLEFYEPYDKSSSDFVPIFTTSPNEMQLQLNYLTEAAFIKVLVVDERVAEVAHDSIPCKEEEVYKSDLRMDAAKFAGVFFATHYSLGGKEFHPLSPIIKEFREETILPKCITNFKLSKNNEVQKFSVQWDLGDNRKIYDKFDVIIIHQGVIETFINRKTSAEPGRDDNKSLAFFVEALKKIVPHVIVDSGRGIPAGLPDNVKFLPFSLINNLLMKDKIAKLSLTRQIMGLSRRNNY